MRCWTPLCWALSTCSQQVQKYSEIIEHITSGTVDGPADMKTVKALLKTDLKAAVATDRPVHEICCTL
jgi:hypothetical protein